MKTTFKKAYIVPESATMQVLEPITPIMGGLSGAGEATGDNTGSESEVNSQLGMAPGRRKPF